MKKSLLIAAATGIFAFVAATISGSATEKKELSDDPHAYFRQLIDAHRELDTTALFLTAQRCEGCHGHDPMGQANITAAGIDINLFDDWETSMMGLAGVDPLWRAKVRHEVLTNPSHSAELQTLCTSCHSPMGHFTAIYRGQQHYTLEDLSQDSLGLSGVGCLGCHSIGQDGLGSRFTGDIPFDTSRVAYGPFMGPMTGPMQLYVNFTPVYSPHVSEGRFCSPCHTLISNTVDLNGQPTGGSFVEQATFHEWLNSAYPEEGTQCQTCHMPKIEEPIKIANGYTGLPGRAPFNLHTFSGANSFMVNLIKQNKGALGVTASDANFDSTLAAINRLLRYQTVDLTLSDPIIEGDSVLFELEIKNKAGHKFPSGYPARRAFVEFVVRSTLGDTLFASGVARPNGTIAGISSLPQPHYQVITSESQAQIYEMIMGDVNGNVTTVLERAASHLKDNRIPPLGFVNDHPVYDTVQIVGGALTDPNFNRNGNFEGTGKDKIYYKLPLASLAGNVNISAKVHYQAVPPHWLDEMRLFSAPEIDAFLAMYDASEKQAIEIARVERSDLILPLGTRTYASASQPIVFPQPSMLNESVFLRWQKSITRMEAFTLSGQRVSVRYVKDNKNGAYRIELPETAGVYMIAVYSGNERHILKIIRRSP